MTTLFTAIFYLWLVLTILLAAMWFLREQDRRRKDQQANDFEDELLSASTANNAVRPAQSSVEEVSADDEAPKEAEPEAEDLLEVDELPEVNGLPEVEELPGIVELLDGVTLPFDLTPLTARIEDPVRHAIFLSPHPDAAEVGTAFADELTQQGFEIEPSGFDQALATRGSDQLSMRISPDAGTVADGPDLRYPTAQENDVAIEVWIGNGSPPPLSN